MAELYVPLEGDGVKIVPLTESHREGLRAACAEDPEIWDIYPFSYAGDHFDPNFERMRADPARKPYAVLIGGKVVGMTAWIDDSPANRSVEIGNSYIVPRLRGGGFNMRLKRLMIDHAFACGYRRIAFRADERNRRSQAAILKLGATKEGVLRSDRVTWTGHVRDTGVFSILAGEWLPQR